MKKTLIYFFILVITKTIIIEALCCGKWSDCSGSLDSALDCFPECNDCESFDRNPPKEKPKQQTPTVFDPRSWMAMIENRQTIDSISIPGTHDTCSYNVAKIAGAGFVRTQDLSINDQLNAGIRYLDIRCRHIDNKFVIHHGSFYLNLNFDDVLNMVSSFLKQNPSETILMRVKLVEYKDGDGNTRSYDDTFRDYDARYPNLFWRNNNNNNPSLGIIRGKVVVLRNGLDDTRYGLNLGSFIIQDNADVYDFTVKVSSIIPFFKKAINGEKRIINHLSGYHAFPAHTPYDIAEHTNECMLDLISLNSPSYVGIIPADYPTKDLIAAIIRTNLYPNTPAPWWCNAAKTFCNGGVDNCCVGFWQSQQEACNACKFSCGGDCQNNPPWWCNAARTFCKGGVDNCCVGRWKSQQEACNSCQFSCGGDCQNNPPWWCNAAKTFCNGGVDTCCVGRWKSQQEACNSCQFSCGGNCNYTIASDIKWKSSGWAFSCDFKDNDLKNAQISGDKCGPLCASTKGCTHFTWTSYRGGTCWMKSGSISKSDAINTNDNSMVCGIVQ